VQLKNAILESWMRRYYFEADLDIGSSGVANYSFRDLRALLGISLDDLDRIVFHDSETLGGAALRRTLAERYLDGDPSRVMVTHGSTEANFLIMNALLEPGDEIVVLEPFYQQLYAIAEARGCVLHRWDLRYERGFRPDLSELEDLLHAGIRMVVVNFPHNPTGATITAEEQRRLIELCAEVDAYLVWDGAFSLLTYEELPLPEPLLAYPRTLSMGTLSKAYGLPGLRVGWCFADAEILERFVRWRDYSLLHLSPLVEQVAARVIENDRLLVSPRLAAARANRALVEDWISRHADLAEWIRPRGGVSGFVKLLPVTDSEPLCHRLARERRVLLVPGSSFNMPQFVRLGFGGPQDQLRAGLEALADLLVEEADCVGSSALASSCSH
jgi:capreomycidine synthase